MHKSLLFIASAAIISCNNQQEKAAGQTTATYGDTSQPVVTIQIPSKFCYANMKGKDTVTLTVEKFPNVVTGKLSYKIYQKDANKGDFEGVMKGDTLIADYRFMSEGKESVRQIAFLIKDSLATEGYADIEEKEGKMVFKNAGNFDFSKGMKLQLIACPVE